MPTLDDLTPVFQQVFADGAIVLRREMTADDIDDWDSLTHVNLVMAVEVKFKVKFALGELLTLKNVGEMLDLLNKKLAK